MPLMLLEDDERGIVEVYAAGGELRCTCGTPQCAHCLHVMSCAQEEADEEFVWTIDVTQSSPTDPFPVQGSPEQQRSWLLRSLPIRKLA